GEPTGIDHNVNPANSADGARTMNNTADTIAAFRQGTTTPPQAPSAMNATAVSDVQIDLQWNDNSSDESGFELQRSADGASWSALASVGTNNSSYSDSGLAPSTLYYYRVRAYNGGGSSGWSNTDSAQTLPPPPPPLAPTPLTATPISGERIDLVWTDVANENGYRLERSLDGVSYGLVASPAADQNSYSDMGLSASTTYYYRVTAFNAGGDSPAASASADTMSFVDYAAVAESTTYGSVTGSYADTASDDGVAERVAETESGGKKSTRHSRLQHRWQFNVGMSNSAILVANVWKSGSTEDDFSFEYSTDGSSYSPLFTVTSTDSANEQMAMLSAGVSGTVYVRATDTDRGQGNRNIETLHVDHLYIQVESGSVGNPPVAPANLNAVAMSASQVDLSWTDMSDDEFGFEVERSTDGSSWQYVAMAAANSNAYTDDTVIGDTFYYYRVNASNAAGPSAWDGPVSVQTPVGAVLSGSGYKVKGTKHVDLSWTGGAAQSWDIYRQGSVIYTVPVGSPGTHTDNIGTKGGGSYTYLMCEAGGTSNCSNEVTVVF
ncbi:MAG: fibronectin type III domain-containing protein, partial [Gammaproteobacteria bacterium]|nr:fibronectin type III domain-containing protein [Gammaproteobacteria bacterium]